MSCDCRTSKILSRQSALVSAFMSLPSKRLQHCEKYDSDHQHRRHLVPPAIIAGRSGVSVCLEVLAPKRRGVVPEGEPDNQRESLRPPGRMPKAALPGEQQ